MTCRRSATSIHLLFLYGVQLTVGIGALIDGSDGVFTLVYVFGSTKTFEHLQLLRLPAFGERFAKGIAENRLRFERKAHESRALPSFRCDSIGFTLASPQKTMLSSHSSGRKIYSSSMSGAGRKDLL